MLKNQTYGLLLLFFLPFLKEVAGSDKPASDIPTIETHLLIPKTKPAVAKIDRDYIKVDASIYFPVEEQTDEDPLITADGSKINEKNPRGHRWLALSRNLLSRWGGKIDYGDSVMVEGISPTLDGVYVVRDAMHRRIKNRVDILVGPNDKIMGYWEDVKLMRL